MALLLFDKILSIPRLLAKEQQINEELIRIKKMTLLIQQIKQVTAYIVYLLVLMNGKINIDSKLFFLKQLYSKQVNIVLVIVHPFFASFVRLPVWSI